MLVCYTPDTAKKWNSSVYSPFTIVHSYQMNVQSQHKIGRNLIKCQDILEMLQILSFILGTMEEGSKCVTLLTSLLWTTYLSATNRNQMFAKFYLLHLKLNKILKWKNKRLLIFVNVFNIKNTYEHLGPNSLSHKMCYTPDKNSNVLGHIFYVNADILMKFEM